MNKLDEKLIKKMDENLNKIKSIYEESMKIYQCSEKQYDQEEFDPFAVGEGEPPFVSDDVLDEVHQEGMTPFPFLNTTVEDFANSVAEKIVKRFKEEGYFSKDGTIHIVTDADYDTELDEVGVLPPFEYVKCQETCYENEHEDKHNKSLTPSDIDLYVKVDNAILCSENITDFRIKTEKPNGTHGKIKIFMTYIPHCMDHNLEKYATGKYTVDIKIANGKFRELGEFYVESFNMYTNASSGDIYYEMVLVKML